MQTIAYIAWAPTTESHIPYIRHISGNIITAAIYKTRVLRKDMSAEIKPFTSAVKNDEPYIAIPTNRNENQKNKNPLRVTETIPIITRLRRNMTLSPFIIMMDGRVNYINFP